MKFLRLPSGIYLNMEKIITLHIIGTDADPKVGIVYQPNERYDQVFEGSDAVKLIEYLDRLAYC